MKHPIRVPITPAAAYFLGNRLLRDGSFNNGGDQLDLTLGQDL